MAVIMSFTAVFTVVPKQSVVQASSTYGTMENNINRIMADASMKSVVSSVTVRKASTGEVIYQANADRKVTPASTLKLLTSAAALETLGEEYRFKTDLLTDGHVAKGVLHGNLYLTGTRGSNSFEKGLRSICSNVIKTWREEDQWRPNR